MLFEMLTQLLPLVCNVATLLYSIWFTYGIVYRSSVSNRLSLQVLLVSTQLFGIFTQTSYITSVVWQVIQSEEDMSIWLLEWIATFLTVSNVFVIALVNLELLKLFSIFFNQDRRFIQFLRLFWSFGYLLMVLNLSYRLVLIIGGQTFHETVSYVPYYNNLYVGLIILWGNAITILLARFILQSKRDDSMTFESKTHIFILNTLTFVIDWLGIFLLWYLAVSWQDTFLDHVAEAAAQTTAAWHGILLSHLLLSLRKIVLNRTTAKKPEMDKVGEQADSQDDPVVFY
ncbi:hypothetical protein EDD86DRAFT_7730 [Gorgonomyces haynaldii]|nr:hypothetical protein EDD86DRAFT_7730 [Gorgonomyces haynaldii]